MPDVYDQDVPKQSVAIDPNESQLASKLLEYTDPINNPWRTDYVKKTLKECYNFKELRQWEGDDMQALARYDIPTVSVDRINRGLDTIKGIDENSGSSMKVVKREMGDERIAQMIDLVRDYVEYTGNFDLPYDEAFDNLLDVGIGICKVGYDEQAQNGQGEAWVENVNIEEFYYSQCKRKDLKDIRWAVHHQVMSWEEAMMIDPDKAGQIKGMKTMLESEWEKNKGQGVQGTFLTRDYGTNAPNLAQSIYRYPDYVNIFEVWLERRIPLKKVGSVVSTDEQGQPLPMPVPKIDNQPIDYQLQEGEQVLSTFVQEQWEQSIVATGNDKSGAIILKQATANDHPFVAMVAERKKSGAPRGYIEVVINHQKRINIAWAQKVAFNNKSIKSPLITRGTEPDYDKAIKQSSFGAVFHVPLTTEVLNINTIPNVNLQAIEEGNVARQDMDFAAAATEGAMRGIVEGGASGIRIAQQQNAAVTPLNKWVKAKKQFKVALGRKLLPILIDKYINNEERLKRILGFKYVELVVGKLDPVTGQPTEQPLQMPVQADVANYDVEITDQAVTDLNKQQSFNAVIELSGDGVPFTDEYKIKNAPIRDVDDALASNEKARSDIIMQLSQQVQMLSNQVQVLEKFVPPEMKKMMGGGDQKQQKSQKSNARIGKNAPQGGQRSMTGGSLGMPTPGGQ